MMTLLYILFVVSFTGYHLTFFSYCAYIFNVNEFPKNACIVSGVINMIYWLLYILYAPVNYEVIAIVGYGSLLLIETRMIFKVRLTQMLFIAVTFTINLFAKRLAVIASIALLTKKSAIYVLGQPDLSIIVTIICFMISISTISFARRLIPRYSLDTILSDNKNLAFLTTAFSILYGTLSAFFLMIDVDGGTRLLMHYIVFGVIVICAFAVFIVFAYSLAELRIQTETFKRLNKKNNDDLEIIKDLELAVMKDSMTQLFTRNYADHYIKKLIDENSMFFVAFIDLDNLKVVNDNHGHDEGDFYIKTVAEIMKDYFKCDAICRYGGDEVLIIGKYIKEEEVTIRLIQSYKAVLNISKLYDKKYKTSVSYGVAYRQTNENISSDKLISIADTRMYELKRANNKNRKVIAAK